MWGEIWLGLSMLDPQRSNHQTKLLHGSCEVQAVAKPGTDSRRSKLLSRKVMQVQPLTLTEHQFWKGFPFLFGSCHENDSQLVECLAGLLEPLPVEIGLEKMQMVIRQGAAKVGLLAHWKHKTPSWKWGHKFSICWNSAKFARYLTYLNSRLACFFGYNLFTLTMSAGQLVQLALSSLFDSCEQMGKFSLSKIERVPSCEVKMMCDVWTRLDMVEANMTRKRANLSLRLSKCECTKWF